MLEVVVDALLDTLKLLPLLLVAHVLIEIFEYHSAGKIKMNKLLSGKFAPLIGGAVGIIPQCGFSVVATNLFAKKHIRLGTLIAVYVATSDEAIPILLSNPSAALKLLPLLACKFVFAVAAGSVINLILRKNELVALKAGEEYVLKGCHGHEIGEHTHEPEQSPLQENNNTNNNTANNTANCNMSSNTLNCNTSSNNANNTANNNANNTANNTANCNTSSNNANITSNNAANYNASNNTSSNAANNATHCETAQYNTANNAANCETAQYNTANNAANCETAQYNTANNAANSDITNNIANNIPSNTANNTASDAGDGKKGQKKKFDWKCFVVHPIMHTLTVGAYILVVNLALGAALFFVGEARLAAFMGGAKFLQPALAALVGLIPNCASSVVISQLYASGTLTLGAAFAGLSVNAGLGVAVLFKENKNLKQNIWIIVGMYLGSVIVGMLLTFLPL